MFPWRLLSVIKDYCLVVIASAAVRDKLFDTALSYPVNTFDPECETITTHSLISAKTYLFVFAYNFL